MPRIGLEPQGREWNSHQRGAWVAVWLQQGNRLSIADIARLCGMGERNARKMMVILEQTLPITCVNGLWQWMSRDA